VMRFRPADPTEHGHSVLSCSSICAGHEHMRVVRRRLFRGVRRRRAAPPYRETSRVRETPDVNPAPTHHRETHRCDSTALR
jgi:hypothetical protein